MDVENNDDLMERIKDMTGCMYLSDLRAPANREKVRQAAASIPASEFPLAEWLAVTSYIVSKTPSCHTQESAKSVLITELDL